MKDSTGSSKKEKEPFPIFFYERFNLLLYLFLVVMNWCWFFSSSKFDLLIFESSRRFACKSEKKLNILMILLVGDDDSGEMACLRDFWWLTATLAGDGLLGPTPTPTPTPTPSCSIPFQTMSRETEQGRETKSQVDWTSLM